MASPKLIVEHATNPPDAERRRVAHEQALRNSRWLQEHWSDLLPAAYGKILAVAGQEGHIAETSEEAWRWAAEAHPEDQGAFVEYVMPPGRRPIHPKRLPRGSTLEVEPIPPRPTEQA